MSQLRLDRDEEKLAQTAVAHGAYIQFSLGSSGENPSGGTALLPVEELKPLSRMIEALRPILVQQGLEPADFVMLDARDVRLPVYLTSWSIAQLLAPHSITEQEWGSVVDHLAATHRSLAARTKQLQSIQADRDALVASADAVQTDDGPKQGTDSDDAVVADETAHSRDEPPIAEQQHAILKATLQFQGVGGRVTFPSNPKEWVSLEPPSAICLKLAPAPVRDLVTIVGIITGYDRSLCALFVDGRIAVTAEAIAGMSLQDLAALVGKHINLKCAPIRSPLQLTIFKHAGDLLKD